MGNANSGELRRSDASLITDLTRQCDEDLAADKLRNTESLYKKQWNTFTKNGLRKESGSLSGKSGWRSRKLRSGTQSVKSYQSYSRQKKQFSEGIEFLSENPLYEWKTRSLEELTVMKEDMHRKEIRALETFRLSGRSKARRHFRKRRRQQKEREMESGMWTLSEKPPPYDQISLKSTKSEESEKIFWKTSKMSLTELQDKERLGSQNMLWRSSKHIQTFCGENAIDVEEVSTVFEADQTQKVIYEADSNIILTSTLKTAGRKRRFSRWTFLRHEDDMKPPTEAKKQPKSKRTASFRVPQKIYSKYNQSDKCSRDVRVNGKKKWKIFKDAQGRKKSEKDEEDEESCDCSCCSCNNCQSKENREKLQEDSSSLVLSEGDMAPNSEEDTRILYQNGKPWRNDNLEKEPQRPPVYNPEDYAQCLKKWGKKGNLGMQMPLYVSQSTGSIERISAEITKSIQSKRQSSPSTKSSASSKNGDEKQSKKEKELTLKLEKEGKNKENVGKELKNPIVTVAPQETEMSLRQFSSVTELLGKLKLDLRLAFPSFVQEFVGDPVDGVTLLLELLRAVQLSQASQQQRCPPQVLRRALLDEHSCLVCLKHCLRCPDASRRLASSSAGLFTLAVCIMSNVTKSRIIALELLTKACEVPATGHKPVSEALSTLRLRFGEPVRFRFLVGMLNSAGAVELLTAAMRFINAFISTAPSVQQKVYIQAELEQAGFDSKILRKTLPNHSESVKAELNKWDKNYFDVETLEMQVAELDSLRDKVQLLEKRVQILQEEKGILQSLEQCLKERCSELEEEVSIKTSTTTLTKSTAHLKPFRNYNSQQALYMNKKNVEKGESTPAEDEGISSSEQELSQDEDCNKGTIPYNITANCEPIVKEVRQFDVSEQKPARAPPTYSKDKIINKNVKNNKMKETNVDDGNEVNPEEDEEETTIDEVIEELRNIVNDAETEVYGQDKQVEAVPKGYRKQEEVLGSMKLKPTRSEFEREYFEEAEIVPSGLLPQPPRRTRSLVHIFLTGTEYDDTSKNEFFEDDTDTESSDSLLTSAREKRTNHKNCHHRSLDVSDSYNSSSSINTRTLFIKQQNDYEDSEPNGKMTFEEAEEVKRYAEKVSKKVVESRVHPDIKREVLNPYKKLTSFQGAKAEESPFSRTKFAPLPVKRSQTFHIATPDNARAGKRTDIKPKPKMGVRGLDLQRNSAGQVRTESIKYQNIDYKKNPDRNCSDRYLKKISKDERYNEKASHPLQRRGSLDGMYFVTEVNEEPKKRLSRAGSHVSNENYLSSHGEEGKNLRSKSLEKMDDGLDSFVDIVFSPEQSKKPSKTEWNIEGNKNIGPRTRRSLAESSLFNQPYLNNLNKETSPKPPQPAQRTSLTRNNSSSIPLHMPVEIKVAPIYNYFGLKTAKSECNLASLSPHKRYPPDGSSSPNEGSEHRKKEETTIYAVPSKQSRLQKFFGNPKFENSVGSNSNSQKYFECNYACTQPAPPPPDKKSPPARSLPSGAPQKTKGLLPKDSSKNEQQKINFFLGTYHQSHTAKGFLSSDSPSPTSPSSGNSFNNTFLIKRGHANAGMYSGSRNGQGGRSPLPVEVTCANGRQSIMSTYSSGTNSTKVTDSLSGLY